ncbi:MAG: F0F1 ATP synthase subunit A [Microthrixaceae bacterium]
MFALEFPSINDIVEWPALFGDGEFFAFNKIALISLIAVVVPTILFLLAAKKGKENPVPRGVQNVVEASVEFMEKQVVMPTIGPDGMRYLPMLTAMFFFIFIGNLFEIIPTSHMPANARMANPLLLALVTWVMFIGVGLKHNGISYLKEALFPPGVPKALYILVTPIEFISTFLVRPFSLAVRLFANMLAGHILLVTFSVLTLGLLLAETSQVFLVPLSIAPFVGLIAFTAFELMVAFLQAYIFSLLAGVYIGGALHPAH